MIGPGKYDDLCTYARITARGRAAVLIIVDGAEGSGFSVQASLADLVRLPDALEEIAKQMRAQHKQGEL